jgi:hypothetical protein
MYVLIASIIAIPVVIVAVGALSWLDPVFVAADEHLGDSSSRLCSDQRK